MMKPVWVFAIIVVMGLFGIYLGDAMNLEGYLGNVFAIGAVGACIVHEMEKKK